jgi:hypothetical protein
VSVLLRSRSVVFFLLFDSHDAAAESITNEVSLCVQIESMHQVRPMSFRGATADPEARGNLGARMAFGTRLPFQSCPVKRGETTQVSSNLNGRS